MTLHVATLVAGASWLGALLAVTFGPHESMSDLAIYAWWVYFAVTIIFGALLSRLVVKAAIHAERTIFEQPWSNSDIRWLEEDKPNPRVRAGS